ncbi:MAG: class I SAM-dependent methyltransferase [Burkholderiales bacterium]|nr:class I SAM-dependent methyltransferase [Burkholderiales bacterium]
MASNVGKHLNTGAEFEDIDVARAYRARSAYPPELYARLCGLAPGRTRALDLGCGPGKLALGLAEAFGEVFAVDPSAAMLGAGRELDQGRHGNVRWVQATAEAFPIPTPCDLIVAGASIHWMDHAVVFPKLAAALGREGVFAVVDGDGPHDASWKAGYLALLARWVGRMGGEFGDPAFRARMTAHEAWIEVMGRETFAATVQQDVEDFIESEHSRATWARAKMGAELAGRFDADLRDLLTPYARLGQIEFQTLSNILWGRSATTAS